MPTRARATSTTSPRRTRARAAAAKGSGGRKPRWQRRSGERPAELVAAGLALFAERGFAGTRLDDVATRAGVSKATVYLYFKSKEHLFEAVVRDSVSPNVDRLESFVDTYAGSTPGLLRELAALIQSFLDSPVPAVAKLVIAEAGNFPRLAELWVSLVARRVFGMVARVIQRGIDRREFRRVAAADVAPGVLAPFFLLGLARHSIAPHLKGVLNPAGILDVHIETIIRGLANGSAPALRRRRT